MITLSENIIDQPYDGIPDFILCPGTQRNAYAKKIRQHKKRAEKLLAKIPKSKTSKQLKNRIKRCFDSYAVRFTYCIKVARDREDHLSVPGIGSITPIKLDKLSKETAGPTKLNEAVHIYPKVKPSNDFRIISIAGFKRRVLQEIVAEILEAIHCGYKRDFSNGGSGREAATHEIIHLIENEKNDFVVVGDFSNFFGSIEHSYIRELLKEFPDAVISHVILNAKAPLSVSGISKLSIETAAFKKMARLGIPQGSPASPRIASALLRVIFKGIAPEGNIVAYRDDFVICTSSLSDVNEIKYTLLSKLSSHIAGPFELKILETKAVKDKFDFLNYRFKFYWWSTVPRKVFVSPNTTAFNNLKDKMRKAAHFKHDNLFEKDVWIAAKGWLNGHPNWKYTSSGLFDATNKVRGFLIDEYGRRKLPCPEYLTQSTEYKNVVLK